MDRRDFLALVGAGLLAALTACAPDSSRTARATTTGRSASGGPGGGTSSTLAGTTAASTAPDTTAPDTTAPDTTMPQSTTSTTIPPPRPGPYEVVTQAVGERSRVAITIDDGYCEECVEGYVAFAESSGVSLTLSPNGAFHDIWDKRADRLRPLIEAGQVQMGNHTWSHPNLLRLGDAAIRAEIERNEEWIEKTFGITSRPWFRPPYGGHSPRTDAAAASVGFTKIMMWNATLGDATLETPQEIMDLARKWFKGGAIILGHANHPTVLHVFDQLQALLAKRSLQPVTLDTLFGTSRSTG